jgi:Tfp pilus assembly protein FimT
VQPGTEEFGVLIPFAGLEPFTMQTIVTTRRLRKGTASSLGFTVLELMICMGIALTLAALAIPTMNAIRQANLREAAANYASFLQNARIQAIQNDTYYAVVPVAGPPASAYVDLQGNNTFVNTDPQLVLPSSVYIRTYANNPPALAALEGLALASSTDPSLNTANNPTFGPRGLPCKPIPNGAYTTCPAFSGAVAGTSYMVFLQSEPDQTWMAIVVNPSARIRIFKYSGGAWAPVS